ncbi:hypothetical protein [Sphingomonas sp. 28-63-12]|uniref:hypothetical protein n=1 Tax=Sphingomonas sp. 28-63-12 TaxID=1970434 RepID=UPI000BC47C8B|nr:MAG: hypothetical protein B7Y47_01940 [Sphingomonas sp. 28-63-12]
MARPLTRAQQLENAAFLRALRRTGNIRLAARQTGLKYGTIQHRRAQHPAFAQAVDATIALAQADCAAQGGLAAPVAERAAISGDDRGHRTRGGEYAVVRGRDGKLQVRSAQPNKLTRQCEQAFLAALSATANVRLSAAAAGASVAAFYRRRRDNPAFAREMRLALQMGYDRIELALLESMQPASHQDDAWRHNDPPPIPPMSANQALQLMYLHQKQARLQSEPAHIRRRRGESAEAHSFRLAAMYKAHLARERERFDIAEAERRARGEPRLFGPEQLPQRPVLPDLAQVTGWSRGKGDAAAYHPDVALFGGWRLGDWEG